MLCTFFFNDDEHLPKEDTQRLSEGDMITIKKQNLKTEASYYNKESKTDVFMYQFTA